LIEALILRNQAFIDKIIGDHTGDSHEYRLNGAGLKMHWEVQRRNVKTPRFTCSVGGDQAEQYPEFVAKARQLIAEKGFKRR
jgi:hypothetical protein